MGQKFIFGDESGNLDFSSKPSASNYYITTTVALDGHCSIGNEILDLRRRLAHDGHLLTDGFHCSEEKQAIRDAVFSLIAEHDFRVDATIMEKRKAIDRLRSNPPRFVKQCWFLHFKWLVPRVATSGDRLFVAQAAVKTAKGRDDLRHALDDVVDQVAPGIDWCAVFWPSRTDPCLWVADYCCWAIQRLYERGDDRSYRLIASKVRSEFQPFRNGTQIFY